MSERPTGPTPANSATAGLRVLVIGPGSAGVSDALRFVEMAPYLRDHGVGLECWSAIDIDEPATEFEQLEAAIGAADVVVLRRSYRTYHSCALCRHRTLDRAEIRDHGLRTGHAVVESPFASLRPLVGLIESEPGVLGHRALVYDTDDDFFSADLPPGGEDYLERDLVERILAAADLVTTTTPVLAARLTGRTPAPVRVIRNALEPAWYGPRRHSDGSGGEVRIVHHGGASRLAEYEVARSAVDLVAASLPAVHRVWIGAAADARLSAAVDEVRPWVRGLPEFGRALADAAPDIGLAPLRDTPYNRCRSELHWLEYSLAGAATVATGFDGPGPYDSIRDGIDGLIARDQGDWLRRLRALASSADLQAELAGRAQERVVGEFSLARRAEEWAEAYRWAVNNVRIHP